MAIHKEPYKRSLKEAEQKGEEGAFWASYNDDCYCKMAIDEAIRRNYDGSHLYTAGIMRVVGEYGLDRVERLLANKIRQSPKDGRFSGKTGNGRKQYLCRRAYLMAMTCGRSRSCPVIPDWLI